VPTIRPEFARGTFNKIILHHTATPREARYGVEWCRKLHVEHKGWRDIGYHFYIEHDGRIREGRPINMSGAHTRGENSQAIGIAYVGGILHGESSCTMTEEQAISISAVVDYLRNTIGKPLPLYGHRDFSATFCPGFNVQDYDWENNKWLR
jgi:N-acetylmuramoyl-L-alanine amidase